MTSNDRRDDGPCMPPPPVRDINDTAGIMSDILIFGVARVDPESRPKKRKSFADWVDDKAKR